MKRGIEGERPHGELTSQQFQQTEQHKPPPESQERQPLPSVWDVLERRDRLLKSLFAKADPKYVRAHKYSPERRAFNKEYRETTRQIGDELAALYAAGTDHDRLILDVYTTLVKTASSEPVDWSRGLSPQETRQFIAKIQPLSDDELRQELHKAQEALERKTARYKKKVETERLNRSLRSSSSSTQS